MNRYKPFLIAMVAVLLAVFFSGLTAILVSAQGDTMQWRYDAQHTGDYSPVAGPLLSNGKLLWNYTTPGQVSSTPAIANGVVYVGAAWGDNKVYALNATTGAKIWNYTTGGYVGICSPAVVNGVVYFGSWDSKVYALYANNGTKKWSFPTLRGWVQSSPAVVNGVVYIGSEDGNVYALNAQTGAQLWNFTTGNAVFSSPAVVNGVVYFGSQDSNLYALDANTGTKLWNYTTGNSVWSSPAVVRGVVYVGSDDNNLYALDAGAGRKIWNYTTGNAIHSSPAVVNGFVYVGSRDNNLYALDAGAGRKLWNYTTGGDVDSSPAVANGVVYVLGGTDNNAYAFNAVTGAKLWNYTTGGAMWGSPAVANGIVYFGSNDRNIYALGTQKTATLTATAPVTAYATQTFSIKGRLSAGASGVGGKTLTIQRSLNNASWTTIGTASTNASTGAYQFKRNETGTGLYYYRVLFPGDPDYSSVTSNVVIVTVTKMPTKLTIVAPNIVEAGDSFKVYGVLTANGAGLGGKNVSLYRYAPATDTWTKVTVVKTSTTGTVGSYSFTVTESTADTYAYNVMYAGTTTYRPSSSVNEWVDVV